MKERGHKPSTLLPGSAAVVSEAGMEIQSDRVILSLPSGESATVLLFGATVTSWIAGGQERLFLSTKAALNSSKPIRGGIPLVFPIFGPSPPAPHPTSKLPQHGFARSSTWSLLGKSAASDSSVTVDFGLSPDNLSPAAREAWPMMFGLIYSVTLATTSLDTKLLVRNEGESSWDFQALFHTYLKVGDVTRVAVEGLKGVQYTDKVLNGEVATEESDELTIQGEVDRVYANVPGTVTVKEDGKPLYMVERSEGLKDVVVWNPWKETAAGMKDFGPEDGHKHMLCVEAGAVGEWLTLEPKSVWEGGVVVSL